MKRKWRCVAPNTLSSTAGDDFYVRPGEIVEIDTEWSVYRGNEKALWWEDDVVRFYVLAEVEEVKSIMKRYD